MTKPKSLLEPTWTNLFQLPQYSYFEDGPHDAHSFSPDMQARWMVDSAMLAYGRAGGKQFSDKQLTEIFRRGGFTHTIRNENWLNKSTGCWAFFASNESWAVLAFRGTSNMKDVFVDFDTAMYREGRAMVHKGFLTMLNQVWYSEVQGWLDAYRLSHPASEIFFTGHSMGGALATLAVSRCRGNISLYTYGCPRVGNRALCDAVTESVGGRWYRYVDGNDWVTRVPLERDGYMHGGTRIHLGSNAAASLGIESGTIDVSEFLRTTPSPDLADHSPSRYLYYVWNDPSE